MTAIDRALAAWGSHDRDDPFQMRNLLDDPVGAKAANDLDGLVLNWLKEARDPFPLEQLRRRRSAYRG